ncbi:helix-turn-helix domain-containing protein [Paenibacillus sp. FSL M7-1046]
MLKQKEGRYENLSISGDRIKKLREARGISQIELADRIGINNSVLSRI